MTLHYNQIAARGLDRLAALSDGLFAIAMTLIVLEIQVPDIGRPASDAQLAEALVGLAPRFVTYLLSFLTLGIFWSAQQTQFSYFARANRHLAWIHLGLLATVALLPFSTSLLAEYIDTRLAVIAYWANIAAFGVFIYGSWIYATRAGLLKEGAEAEASTAIKRRIFIAQALYAFGAALCLISTYLSIAFIVLVQLNYAIAPRIPFLSRL
jgi:uncharacterized membrane protein